METAETKPKYGSGVLHKPARPMEVYISEDGCMYLCDKPIDPNKPLDEQACWKCKDLAFTRID